MKMRSIVTITLSLAIAAVLASAAWDVSADFDTSSNVAGNVWQTYGQLPYDAGTPDPSGFILYDQAGTVVDPNAPFAWQDQASASVDTKGAVSFNESAQFKTFFGIDWEPMEVDLVPDQGGVVASTARFTAPQDGLYSVHAEFSDNQDCCAGREGDAWVLTDSATEFHMAKLPASNAMTHVTGSPRVWEIFDGNLSLSAGDSVYFASGKGFQGGGDHVGLRATLDLVSSAPFAITAVSYNKAANEVSITFNSMPGKPYALDVSTDLTGWGEFDDGIEGTGISTTVTNNMLAPGSRYFFRIREL